ncbi:hypothetical protein ACP275_08G027200 [Erythranthe tilingii]
MGTKIRANTLLREYPPMGSHYLGNQSFQNDPEKVRQTILEHESIFRQQLQELHRVYRRQKELTNEVKRGGVFPNGTYELGFPKLPLVDQASYNRDTKLSLCNNNADASMYNLYFKRTDRHTGDLRTTNSVDGEVSANSCSKFNLVTKDLLKNSIIGTNEKNGKEHLYDDFSEGRRYDREPLASPQSLLLAEKEFLNRRSKKIFGVEIYEENDDLFDFNPPMSSTLGPKFGPQQENHRVVCFEPSSWIASTSMQKFNLDGKNEKSKAVEREPVKYFENSDHINSKKSVISKNDSENPNRGLPWFLRTSQVSNDMSKEKKSSYFMNMDSLQNCSMDFFKKAEVPDGSFRTLKPETELSPKIFGFPISDMVQSCKDLNSGDKNGSKANSMHHIDLNMSLDDEDVAATSAIYEIATTNASPKEASTEKITDISHEEHDRIAAEAIIAMSSSSPSSAEVESSSNNNNLEWFAEIISSQHSDEMDEFELTTLKLEDTKEEHYHYTPFELYNNPPTDDDNRASSSKSSQRGQSRRGRQQRKDFQRDVLPGLVTLSRRQVAEDFQTFEELMKGEQGGNWQLRLSQRGSVRNGRGRKRLNTTTCSGAKTVCSTEMDRPVCEMERPVCGIEERNGLSGWGKRTRRLPRQRCSNAVLSFTVKC